jgi:hypothetical protein
MTTDDRPRTGGGGWPEDDKLQMAEDGSQRSEIGGRLRCGTARRELKRGRDGILRGDGAFAGLGGVEVR